jgi:ABC-2 type transport system ATP-binding protein
MAEPAVQTVELTKRYRGQVAVDRLTLDVAESEVFGLLGPNGAGKTTTILMLLGLSEPTSGTARICGLDPTRASVRVKRLAGYLPENVGFYDDMTGAENLLYVARLNGLRDREARPRIDDALEVVGLAGERRKRVGAFSKGMRQRLGIAEVLVKQPRVVFLDEPTIGLDPDATQRMLALIHSLSRELGITVFFSSHLLDQVQRISDRVGIMLGGRLVAAGPIDELARQSLGVDHERYTLEEIYMRHFRQEQPAAPPVSAGR